MINISNISCVIIAKNAEKTIDKTLKSLISFNEVIVYSNDSVDDTDNIAKSYKNVKLIQGEFLGFGETKNKAASYATNEWILSLDSDEVLSEAFVNVLKNIDLKSTNVYSITRENYYKDQLIKYCWGDDIIVRIYNKNITSFNTKKVHEYVLSNTLNIVNIEEVVKHFPYSSISDFIVKLDRYSTIYAQDNVGRKKSSPFKAFFNANFSFFKTYFLKRGFLDGYAGLIIAFSHMATNFYKYMKLYELNKEQN